MFYLFDIVEIFSNGKRNFRRIQRGHPARRSRERAGTERISSENDETRGSGTAPPGPKWGGKNALLPRSF